MTIIKVIPKPIEFEAFQFKADMENHDLPQYFNGEIVTYKKVVNKEPYKRISMRVGNRTPKYNVGHWFVRSGNVWRPVAASTFNRLYSIVEDSNAASEHADQNNQNG